MWTWSNFKSMCKMMQTYCFLYFCVSPFHPRPSPPQGRQHNSLSPMASALSAAFLTGLGSELRVCLEQTVFRQHIMGEACRFPGVSCYLVSLLGKWLLLRPGHVYRPVLWGSDYSSRTRRLLICSKRILQRLHFVYIKPIIQQRILCFF